MATGANESIATICIKNVCFYFSIISFILEMYQYVTIGSECSPAYALRVLQLRSFALPFDWVVSKIESLERCFQEDFAKYHTNLRYNESNTRLIDEYGFEFPHDYPLVDPVMSDEDFYNEDVNNTITKLWILYYPTIKEKYDRRIMRFRAIFADPRPIIVLTRHRTHDVSKLRELIRTYYHRDDVIYLNACPEPFDDGQIKNINTEQHGIWNDYAVWKIELEKITKLI